MKDKILISLEELKKAMDENNQRMLNLLNRVSLIGKKYHSDDKTDQESDVDSDEDYSDEEIDESEYGDPDEDPFIENDPPNKGEESGGIIYDEPGEIIKDEESDTKYQQRQAYSTTPTLFSMIVKQKVKDIDAREARISKE